MKFVSPPSENFRPVQTCNGIAVTLPYVTLHAAKLVVTVPLTIVAAKT